MTAHYCTHVIYFHMLHYEKEKQQETIIVNLTLPTTNNNRRMSVTNS